MIYTSLENKKIKEIKKLKNKKYRKSTNLFLVEGEHLVLEAFKKGILNKLIILEGHDLNLDVEKIIVSKQVLKSISDLDTPASVCGICVKPSSKEINGNVLMVDSVQDPGNLGTIIRSAAAFNIDTVILSNQTVDPYSPKVLRATQGMIFNIDLIMDDLESRISILKNKGYTIYATNVSKGDNLYKLEKNKKFVIIVGNEGSGVSSNLLEKADSFLQIKTNEKCESLNVAVATSIILYELDK